MHESFKKRKPDTTSGFLSPVGLIVSKCTCGITHLTDVYGSDDDVIAFDETRIKEQDIQTDAGE